MPRLSDLKYPTPYDQEINTRLFRYMSYVLTGKDVAAGQQLEQTHQLAEDMLGMTKYAIAPSSRAKYKVPQSLLSSLQELVKVSIQQQEEALIAKAKK